MVAESSKMSLEASEDQTGVMWCDAQWLSHFPLTEATALHYFSMSQFYDTTCNNELIKMQQLDMALLKTMAGIEYSVASPCPNLFVVTKARRTLNPVKTSPLATYYIHDGSIYQAPSLHAVLSTRLVQALHHMRKAFDVMQGAAVLSTSGKYSWESLPTPVDDAPARDAMDMSTGEHKALEDMLFDIYQKNQEIITDLEQKQSNSQAAKPEPSSAPPNP